VIVKRKLEAAHLGRFLPKEKQQAQKQRKPEHDGE
jgi:hypothetical protein